MKRTCVFALCLFIAVSIRLSIPSAAQYDPIVYQAQKALKVRGYNPGTPDGLWGKSTESAIKHFQVDTGLPVTGKLDEQTKEKLGVVSGRSPARMKERRIALVIGNGNYRNAPLKNPVNDVADMANALERCGFKVDKRIDVPQETMEDAIREFGSQLHEETVGLFYYAGHGIQVDGRNYLIPISARIVKEKDVKYKAVDLYQVLDEMGSARNGLNIVILDACRNNPLERSWRRSRNKGLARVKGPKGTLIAYSTAPEATAEDGEGRNSPYTKHLLRAMNIPDLPIEQVFKEVLKGVDNETSGQQTPWMSSSFTGDFYFASSGAVVSRPAETPSGSAIEISANVTGARVLVDGRGVGRTPVSGVAVAPGTHRIRVEKEGFKPYEKQVRVEAGRTFSMQVYLDKMKPRKGRLYVETDPSEANVDIPGIGRFYQGIELEPGRYRVEVSASGYETEALSVAIDAGEDKSVSIRLSRSEPADPPRFTNSLGMEFVKISAGSFMMGRALSADEIARKYGGKAEWFKDEHPRHRVTLAKPFYMQATEVTVGQWRAFVRDTGYKTEAETGGGAYIWTGDKWEKKEGYYWDNPGFSQTESHPVTCVSWNDVQAYIKWLNRKEGKNYRLPTEAEWEYSARAGTTTPFAFGNCLSTDQANYDGNYPGSDCSKGEYRKKTIPVAGLKANDWGLYDMHGNVWEWCSDWYGDYSSGSVADPKGPSSGSSRVLRGGGWSHYARYCRSAVRVRNDPASRSGHFGFRLVLPSGQ